jgi:hypothetical protein
MVQFRWEMATIVGFMILPRIVLNTVATEDETVHCRNCGAAVSYHYCAVCGQETKLHVPSATEFVHEFITHYVAFEGKLWQSLRLLVTSPGKLTGEYLAGRRARYIQPLRLYLTFSILFFALFKFGGFEVVSNGEAPPTRESHATSGKGAGAKADLERELKAEMSSEGISGDIPLHNMIAGWSPRAAASIKKFDALPDAEKNKIYQRAFFSYAPYGMFLLLPLFAFYLKLLYLGSGRRYGEHLLFALHSNAFAFLMIGLIMVLDIAPVRTLLVGWLMLYLPLAMQRVYGGRRWLSGLRWVTLGVLHIVSLFVAVILSTFVMAMISN